MRFAHLILICIFLAACSKENEDSNPSTNKKSVKYDEIYELHLRAGLPEAHDILVWQNTVSPNGVITFHGGVDYHNSTNLFESHYVEANAVDGIVCDQTLLDDAYNWVFYFEEARSKFVIAAIPDSGNLTSTPEVRKYQEGDCDISTLFNVEADFKKMDPGIDEAGTQDMVYLDGHYYFLGSTLSQTAGTETVLWKYNETGDLVDYLVVDKGTFGEMFFNDQGIVLLREAHNEFDLYFIDPASMTLTTKTHTSWPHPFYNGQVIHQTSSNYFFHCPWVGNRRQDLLLVKYDNSGNTLWTKTHSVSSSMGDYKPALSNDNGMIFVGIDETDTRRLIVHKVDGQNGDLVYEHISEPFQFQLTQIFNHAQMEDGTLVVLCQFQNGLVYKAGIIKTKVD